MKVILLQDIRKVGRKWEIKEVADGYAKNVLIPKGLVKVATAVDIKKIESQKAIDAQHHTEKIQHLQEVAKKLTNEVLEFKVKAGENGAVFGSVTEKDIEKSLEKNGVKSAKVLLPKHIKTLGIHEVEVELDPEIKIVIKVNVTAE